MTNEEVIKLIQINEEEENVPKVVASYMEADGYGWGSNWLSGYLAHESCLTCMKRHEKSLDKSGEQ